MNAHLTPAILALLCFAILSNNAPAQQMPASAPTGLPPLLAPVEGIKYITLADIAKSNQIAAKNIQESHDNGFVMQRPGAADFLDDWVEIAKKVTAKKINTLGSNKKISTIHLADLTKTPFEKLNYIGTIQEGTNYGGKGLDPNQLPFTAPKLVIREPGDVSVPSPIGQVYRVFTGDNGLIVYLSEWDLSVRHGGITLIREMFTESVGSSLAGLALSKTPEGKFISALQWTEGTKVITLETNTFAKKGTKEYEELMALGNSIAGK